MLKRKLIAAILFALASPSIAQDLPAKYEVVPTGLSNASFMNNQGFVVGSVQTRAGFPGKATTWSNGTLTQVPLEKGHRESNLTFVGQDNVVLGNSITTSRSKQLSFKLENGKLSWLPSLTGKLSSPTGMNKSGVIVGTATNSAQQQRAFLFDGKIKDLGTLGGPSSSALRINDSGVVVGWSSISVSSKFQHAFKLQNGAMVDLTPGIAFSSWAYGINNDGDVVGAMDTDKGRRAVLWSNGSTFLTPELQFGIASSINSYKVVVGTMEVATEQTIDGQVFVNRDLNAFVWAKGQLVNLNNKIDPKSGFLLTRGVCVNDKGEILAIGLKDGKQQAVILRPN